MFFNICIIIVKSANTLYYNYSSKYVGESDYKWISASDETCIATDGTNMNCCTNRIMFN